ncbi:hypothetical protein PIB30_050020 [Stylosanthes scabra]|uniref:Uncharacterized protein n=1 Tax=Stylosanthes scabra TaxID=79078 RepID=A0ABU6VJ34_9FABA|nr:hypothetical protein [Stylosanthes scabra]
MMTNLSECISAVLKGTRYPPISAIVRATYERLQQLWIRKGQEAQAQVVAGSIWSQYLLSEIEKSKSELPKMRVLGCDRRGTVFVVEEVLPFPHSRQSQYRVHVVVACAAIGIECGAYVDHVFGMEVAFGVMQRTSRLSRISGFGRSGMDRQLSQTQLCAASTRGIPCPQEYEMRWTWLSARRRDADYAARWVIPVVVSLMPHTLRMSSFHK